MILVEEEAGDGEASKEQNSQAQQQFIYIPFIQQSLRQ